MEQVFEWDGEKARSNFIKHHVSFDEAETIFDDPLAVTINDPFHSTDEDRFVKVGESDRERLLLVTYTERGDSIRIISARKADPRERRNYERNA